MVGVTSMLEKYLRQRIMLRAFGYCFLAIGCVAQEITRDTTTPASESQVLPSKEVKKHDAWSWSQPEIPSSSVLHASTSSESQLSPSFYLPGLNLNGHGIDFQRTEYSPYHFETAISEDSHHATSLKDAENSLGTITKHFAVVSFIGLLLLFAIIQNTIVAAKRGDTLIDNQGTREKRDTIVSLRGLDLMVRDCPYTTPEEAAVLNDAAKVRCMQRTLCLQNRKLGKNLGKTGKLVAKFLTATVKNSLKAHPGWDNVVEDAGEAGLRGDDCDILYRDCDSSKI